MNNFYNNLNIPFFGPKPETEKLAEELLSAGGDEVKNKYGQGALFEKYFALDDNYFSVADVIKTQLHAFSAAFYPPSSNIIPRFNKEVELVSLLSSFDGSVDDLKSKLIKIEPNLKVFDPNRLDELKIQAQKILSAYTLLQSLLLDNFAAEYLPDTLNLIKLDDDKYSLIVEKVDNISINLAEELNRLQKGRNEEINKEIIAKCVELFRLSNRSITFIENKKDEHNINNLIDIVDRIEISCNIAQKIRKELPQTSDPALILDFIKNYIRPMVMI